MRLIEHKFSEVKLVELTQIFKRVITAYQKYNIINLNALSLTALIPDETQLISARQTKIVGKCLVLA